MVGAAAVSAGYQYTNKMNPAFALAADLNPGTGAGQNSRNHERRGQNVLYADYHVEWKFTSLCGVRIGRNAMVAAGAVVVRVRSGPVLSPPALLATIRKW